MTHLRIASSLFVLSTFGCAATTAEPNQQTRASVEATPPPEVASLRTDRTPCADIQAFVSEHHIANLYRSDGAFERVVSGAAFCQWSEGTGTRPYWVESSDSAACYAGEVCFDDGQHDQR